MTDDKTRPNPDDRPELAKPGQSGHEAQQKQESTSANPGPRVSPGRRPLFRS
jgi:hypothetical protein